jgi:hypothetical protein
MVLEQLLPSVYWWRKALMRRYHIETGKSSDALVSEEMHCASAFGVYYDQLFLPVSAYTHTHRSTVARICITVDSQPEK